MPIMRKHSGSSPTFSAIANRSQRDARQSIGVLPNGFHWQARTLFNTANAEKGQIWMHSNFFQPRRLLPPK